MDGAVDHRPELSSGLGSTRWCPDLRGAAMVVTGGSAGIGDAIVEVAQRLGARVGVIDLAPSQRTDTYVKADISDPSEATEALTLLANKLGGVSVLVNNAGVATAGSFAELSDDQWRRTLAVNLDGVFHCSRAALPFLREASNASIVNVGSIAGRSYSRTASVAYATSKGGVIAFTRQLAVELARESLRVNCVCPGLVDTQIMAQNTSPERLAELMETIPLGRLGAPTEVAAAVCFLASHAASYLTGAVIDVTGGLA